MKETFSVADYVIFTLSLVISSLIGFYYACTGGKQKTTKEFLFGDKEMKSFPVAMSLIASCTSAVGVLGVSAEVYLNGAMFCMTGINMIFTAILTAYIYIPMFHRLNVSSVYEYLELRFDPSIRLIGSVLFVFQMMLYMAVALYGPALALSQVTGLSLWASILGSGIVCTIYTAVGGLKAVIWTDTFQQTVIICGLLAIVIKGFMLAGGGDVIWSVVKENGRAEFFDFNFDPTVRHTFWTVVVGGIFTWLPVYGTNQAMVQRYLSIKDLRKSQLAVFITVPIFIIIHILFLLCGWVIYVKYIGCDPKLNKRITSYDQILPLFVMETLSDAPGLPGLFVACVYSASLSTVSSGLNSIATVFLEDVIKLIYLKKRKELDDALATTLSKIIAVVFGILTIALAFLSGVLGNTILQIALSFNGIVGGPLLGVFTLGMFCPWVNSKSALFSLLLSLTMVLWIGLGNIFIKLPKTFLTLSADNCSSIYNQTLELYQLYNHNVTASQELVLSPHSDCINPIYTISYLYYGLVAAVVVLVTGNIMTLFTGKANLAEINPNLYYPLCYRFLCFLPAKWIERGKILTKYENVMPPFSKTNNNVIAIKLKDYGNSEDQKTFQEYDSNDNVPADTVALRESDV